VYEHITVVTSDASPCDETLENDTYIVLPSGHVSFAQDCERALLTHQTDYDRERLQHVIEILEEAIRRIRQQYGL